MKRIICFIKNLYYFCGRAEWGLGHEYEPDPSKFGHIICKTCGLDANVNIFYPMDTNAVKCAKCGLIIYKENLEDMIDHKCEKIEEKSNIIR